MDTKYYMGVDPGFLNGAVAVISNDLNEVYFFDIGESLNDLCEFFQKWGPYIKTATIEKVGAFPKQGISSALNFGRGIGWVEALLTNYYIPHEYIVPTKWIQVVSSKPETIKKDPTLDTKASSKLRASYKKALKQATYNFCKKRFPRADLRSFYKDSNRADALAIAFYGWIKYREIGETIADTSHVL